ncbi:hypothetical protein [Moorena sp. SIO4G3]|uniref:hypothetical protein n=1 Tax=Moorena sp. SIO4G3 TaxID=2607821 RepID=UPI00142A360C|nr:hypothetical protein [Moorena sp. SIO4G3]NEO76611.1 hypothetical protein [Moorena sp. SIO4G3]
MATLRERPRYANGHAGRVRMVQQQQSLAMIIRYPSLDAQPLLSPKIPEVG